MAVIPLKGVTAVLYLYLYLYNAVPGYCTFTYFDYNSLGECMRYGFMYYHIHIPHYSRGICIWEKSVLSYVSTCIMSLCLASHLLIAIEF